MAFTKKWIKAGDNWKMCRIYKTKSGKIAVQLSLAADSKTNPGTPGAWVRKRPHYFRNINSVVDYLDNEYLLSHIDMDQVKQVIGEAV